MPTLARCHTCGWTEEYESNMDAKNDAQDHECQEKDAEVEDVFEEEQ